MEENTETRVSTDSDSRRQTDGTRRSRRRVALLLILLVLVAGVAVNRQFTLFVVQPIGAVPEGRTVLIRRAGALNFIDSADGICYRTQGGVSLLCRGVVLGQVLDGNEPLLRLPYSERLYLISTGGRTFER